MRSVAVDLDAVLGDTRPLWAAWLDDLRRRARVELDLPEDRVAAAAALDSVVGNWRQLLERFAEDHAPVYLRPNPAANTALRGLRAGGVSVTAFTDAPEPLARIAAAQLGVARCVDSVVPASAGPGAGTVVLRSLQELLAHAP